MGGGVTGGSLMVRSNGLLNARNAFPLLIAATLLGSGTAIALSDGETIRACV